MVVGSEVEQEKRQKKNNQQLPLAKRGVQSL